MDNDLRSILRGSIARVLHIDDQITLSDAISRTISSAKDAGISTDREQLTQYTSAFVRRGIINPNLLHGQGMGVHFFLVSGRDGGLEQIVRDSSRTRAGISQYVLYGEFDSLIVLTGTSQEADKLDDRLASGAYERPLRFRGDSCVLAYGHVPRAGRIEAIDEDAIQRAVDQYDVHIDSAECQRQVSLGNILGPTWVDSSGEPMFPVTAWIGLNHTGRPGRISTETICDTLRAYDKIGSALIHLFRVEAGHPYHYLAKVVCMSMIELDTITNAIGATSINGVRLESHTLVVASGTDTLPNLRSADVNAVGISPNLDPIQELADETFRKLPEVARVRFNQFDPVKQIAIMRNLNRLDQAMSEVAEAVGHDIEGVESAADMFREESVMKDKPSFAGAVMQAAAPIEGEARRFLSKLAYAIIGPSRKAQIDTMHLSNAKYSKLSLSQIARALEAIQLSEEFGSAIEDSVSPLIEHINSFAQRRNLYAHGSADFAAVADGIDHAGSTLADGIRLLGDLIVGSRMFTPEQSQPETGFISIRQKTDGGAPMVFVSHSTQDSKTAERISLGLSGLDYRCWYDQWELVGGDSILGKISEGLSGSDILIVLLSEASVASNWVRHELDSARVQQLSGANVLVLPVRLDDCQIPADLAPYKWIDMRQDFEHGLMEIHRSISRFRK